MGEVHHLVQHHGVEECAALIRFLPPEKLRAVIDLDVWQNTAAGAKGRAEVFDAAQFLLWLQALLSAGDDEAVEALREMGTEFTAGAFAHFLEVVPMDVYAMNKAESGLATEDKNVEHGNPLELGVYAEAFVWLQPGLCLEDVRETFLELLAACDQHDPEFLSGVFFHTTQQISDEVVKDDFHSDRDGRLEQSGYVPAPKAYEYLLRFRTEWGISRFARSSLQGNWGLKEWQTFLHSLSDLPSSDSTSRGPLAALSLAEHKGPAKPAFVSELMTFSRSQGSEVSQVFQEHWLFLANLLAIGWEHQGEALGPGRAMALLECIVSLGVQICSLRENSPAEPDFFWPGNDKVCNACDLFEVGWHFLLQGMTLPAARLLDARLKNRDRRNKTLREGWIRACSKRHLTQGCSMASWVLEGRYRLVNEILEELAAALPTDALLILRLFLDPSPALPQKRGPGTSPYHDRSHSGQKHIPRSEWMATWGAEIVYLENLKNAFSDAQKN